MWITEQYLNYKYELEIAKEISLSADHTKMFEVFNWIDGKRKELLVNYATFIGETGNLENISQSEFEFIMAETARDIIEPTLN